MTVATKHQPPVVVRSPWRYWTALAALAAGYWLSAFFYRPWRAPEANLPTAHVRLASDLARVGRNGEAIEQCRAALRLSPDDVLARYNLAVFLRDEGQSTEAEVELRRLLERAPRFAQAPVLLGTILAARGDAAGAALAWQAAGDHPAAVENLRRLQGRSQEPRSPERKQP